MADLPQSFLDSMKEILGEDYEAFLAGFDGQRQYGLRVNTLKMNLEEFERIAPFHLKKVPWISNGYFYEAEDAPAKHPFYSAGLYYLQEPSAMTPHQDLKYSRASGFLICVRHREGRQRNLEQPYREKAFWWQMILIQQEREHYFVILSYLVFLIVL